MLFFIQLFLLFPLLITIAYYDNIQRANLTCWVKYLAILDQDNLVYCKLKWSLSYRCRCQKQQIFNWEHKIWMKINLNQPPFKKHIGFVSKNKRNLENNIHATGESIYSKILVVNSVFVSWLSDVSFVIYVNILFPTIKKVANYLIAVRLLLSYCILKYEFVLFGVGCVTSFGKKCFNCFSHHWKQDVFINYL